ncbi:hypothetical protein GBAR_LOCUS15724 [Geodia barretti]|uniref:Uncharacterized protein n=1 Tax=Geodia barretti TaxID=519541 RepID=A0AA35SDL1_GEOBA|nr:hypothetical protein GBAR_LOCUS15724 [Geodia barretti]
MEPTHIIVKGVLRLAAIVFAVILVVVSAITLGIVNSNRDFDEIREYRSAPQSIKQLEDLVDSTVSTSAWLILLSIIVVVWQALYSVLLLMSSLLSFLQRYSVVLAITDVGLSLSAVVCFLATTIACIVLADAWGGPPEACDRYSIYYRGLNCDHNHLEGTNGTAALLCTVELVLLAVLGVLSAAGCLPVMVVCLRGAKRASRPISSKEPGAVDT